LCHREILRLSDGKDTMRLTRCIEALGDLVVLADQSTPRKNAKSSDGHRPHCSAHLLQLGSGSESDSSIDEDGDPIDETVLAYLIHKMVLKNVTGFISSDRRDRLSA
jgi:hypothetical protein